MNQCPICQSIQPDGQFFCPDCGSKLVPVPQEKEKKGQSQEATKYTKTATSKSSKAVRIAFVVILIAALAGDIFFYSAYSNYSGMYWELWRENWQTDKDLQAAEEKLSTAEEMLDQVQKEQVQTKKELDSLSELSNLCSYGTDNYFADKYILVLSKSETKNVAIHWNGSGTMTRHDSDTGKATCKWADDWTDNTTIDVIVTGQSSGYSILTFTNDVDDDTFNVLVIVKD